MASRTATAESTRAAFRKAAEHVDAMGFASEETYLSWCRRNGFAATANKPRWQRDEERSLRAEQRAFAAAERMRTSHRCVADELLIACNRGHWRDDPAAPTAVRKFCRIAGAMGIHGKTRKALASLLTHLLRGSTRKTVVRLCRGTSMAGVLGYAEGNTFPEALVAIAAESDGWIRPIKTFKPRIRSSSRFLPALLRHLFVRYEMPAFMDLAWLEGHTMAGQRHRRWYRHLGLGRSIRECDTPLPMTRKMAHAFVSAADGTLPDAAVRRAQVIASGGPPALANAVMGSRLAEHFGHEDFWQTVVAWLIRQPMLDPVHVGPIVDYLHHQRFVPTPVFADGRLTRDVLQPGLSMAGRTAGSLLRQVDDWHDQLGRGNAVQVPNWDPSGIPGFREDVPDEAGRVASRWSVRELVSSDALQAEGRAMQHCVATYAGTCSRGATSIWTVERLITKGDRPPELTKLLTVEVSNRQRTIRQVRGRNNRSATPQERGLLRRWATHARLTLLDGA